MATFDLNPHKEVGIDTFMSILEGQLEEHGAVALVLDGKVLCHVISPKLHLQALGHLLAKRDYGDAPPPTLSVGEDGNMKLDVPPGLLTRAAATAVMIS